MRRRLLALVTLFFLSAGVANAQNIISATSSVYLPLITKAGGKANSQPTHSGEGTYYGATGTGNCSYPATPNNLMVGAMNQTDYANSAICGAYVTLTGPKGTATIRIVDRCPECKPGDIDLSVEAFDKIAERSAGRVPITWKIISPDISGNLIYYIKEGSSQWWTAVQVRNHRNPIAKFEYKNASGQFEELPRMEYNYFLKDSGMGTGPYTFRVTDIYGNQIVDTGIPLTVTTEIAGAAQFPKE